MVSENEDLSGASPDESGDGSGLKYSNVLAEEAHHEHQEKRFMRVTIFVAVIGLAIIFLLSGLNMARTVGEGILGNQKELIRVLTNPEISGKAFENERPNVSVSAAALPLTASSSKATTAGIEEKSTGASLLTLTEHQNWLSAGSLLTLVAFVLGVGLTLLLTLIRNVFRAQEDESKHSTNDIGSDLATPISRLIEEFIGFMRKKLSP